MRFYKFRTAVVIYLVKFITWFFAVEIPPILSVAAIIKKGKKILFIKLSYLDGYGLPGGLIKSGESVEEGLKREVLEETGLKIVNCRFFGSYPTKSKGIGKLALVYEVDAVGILKSSSEGTSGWFDPRDLKDNFAYEDNKKAIEDYFENE